MALCTAASCGALAEPAECSYYYAENLIEAFQMDVSLIIADPYPEYMALSIRISYPEAFPHHAIEYFNVYLNDQQAYPLYLNETIDLGYSAPSAFTGMIPLAGELSSISIVPVGHAELGEWRDAAFTLEDFEKIE